MPNDPKGNKQPQVVALRQDIFKSLDKEYNDSRPKLPTFTAFINVILECKIKKERILKMIFPDLRIVAIDPREGIYVKDSKLDLVVEVDVDNDEPYDSICRYDKSSTCDHVKYALMSPRFPDVYENIYNGGEESLEEEDSPPNTKLPLKF